MINTVKGDLIKMAKSGQFNVIVHGCNCFHTFGAGIAKQIKHEFPRAFGTDLRTIRGDKNKLGTNSYSYITELNIFVVNAYTQYSTSKNGESVVEYEAIRKCLREIPKNFPGYKIGMPKIGAGLAGGDWDIIFKIIQEELSEQDVTIVEWDKG